MLYSLRATLPLCRSPFGQFIKCVYVKADLNCVDWTYNISITRYEQKYWYISGQRVVLKVCTPGPRTLYPKTQ